MQPMQRTFPEKFCGCLFFLVVLLGEIVTFCNITPTPLNFMFKLYRTIYNLVILYENRYEISTDLRVINENFVSLQH